MVSEAGKVVPLTCHGHSRPVTHLDFSSLTEDGKYYLISACKDNNPMLRDGITGDWIGTFLGHKGAIWQSRLSTDVTLAATGSADFSAKIWQANTGECLHTLTHRHIVRAVAFHPIPQPHLVATGGAEKKLRIYDLNHAPLSGLSGYTNGSAPAEASTIPAQEVGANLHGGTIRSILWDDDPNIIITAADDHTIRWWDLRSWSIVQEKAVSGIPGTCEHDRSAAGIGSGSSPLVVSAGKTLHFFDGPTSRTLVKEITLPYEATAAAWSKGSGKFVTGSKTDTWVRVYDFGREDGTGAGELDVSKGHHGPVWTIAFSPDAKLYATGSEDGTIKLWKSAAGPYGLWT